jgi:hypothetical protein
MQLACLIQLHLMEHKVICNVLLITCRLLVIKVNYMSNLADIENKSFYEVTYVKSNLNMN